MISRRLLVSGRVQGVGYREAMCREAQKRGVNGWVRNRADGCVEALVQGDDNAVAAVIAWARTGPPMARVTHLAMSPPDAEHDRLYSTFDRWPSV
jgi:acylphosphatase